MSAPTKWERLPALAGRGNPCLNCPPIESTLPLDAVIAVGFGDAHASRDGEIVYSEPSAITGTVVCPESRCNWGETDPGVVCGRCGGVGRIEDPSAPEPEYWDVAEVEKLASADPDHDWRIVMFGPLHGEVYQRQGDAKWVLVEKNEGFA